jgi:propionyl-CoA carboxylase alpha chain
MDVPPMIEKVLVANRGEIARRVFRTCRDLGIGTVAVFSDPDQHAAHVADADEGVRLAGASALQTYLRGDLIVAAASATGADAIHPGYGFLSENAGFAREVVAAGLTWIGPPAEAIEAIASKDVAKELVSAAGVPVLGTLDRERIGEAELPVLVKAAAGGGGRGMRIVRTLAELDTAVASASREAGAAFGDDTVFVERYLERARHIEVQIMADTHGTVWTLGERECSIQRRHQKVVEESPSVAVSPEIRAGLCEAARNVVTSIGYVGAGTVEFLLAETGEFFFLEVNTRLQVEHPVTECRFGLDLVALQIEVAEGGALPPEPPEPRGHAVEVRLCAEDPQHEWRPSSGRLHALDIPGVDVEFDIPAGARGLRLDSSVAGSADVSVYYDSMLAKVISYAPTRIEATRALAAALEKARIHGVTTNRDLLVRILRDPDFVAGRTDTHFLTRESSLGLREPRVGEHALALSAVAAAVTDVARNAEDATVLPGVPRGWRNVRSQPQAKSFEGPLGSVDVRYAIDRDGLVVEDRPDLGVLSYDAGRATLWVDGVARTFTVSCYDDDRLFVDSAWGGAVLRSVDPLPLPDGSQGPAGSLDAPISGTVVRVMVAAGDRVEIGDPLLVIEAMKMEHVLTSSESGVATEIRARVGQHVDVGTRLVVVSADEPEDRPAE